MFLTSYVGAKAVTPILRGKCFYRILPSFFNQAPLPTEVNKPLKIYYFRSQIYGLQEVLKREKFIFFLQACTTGLSQNFLAELKLKQATNAHLTFTSVRLDCSDISTRLIYVYFACVYALTS